MFGQLSQTLSTHHAPLETGSRKRSGLVVTLKTFDLRPVQRTFNRYRHPTDRDISYSARRRRGRGGEYPVK